MLKSISTALKLRLLSPSPDFDRNIWNSTTLLARNLHITWLQSYHTCHLTLGMPTSLKQILDPYMFLLLDFKVAVFPVYVILDFLWEVIVHYELVPGAVVWYFVSARALAGFLLLDWWIYRWHCSVVRVLNLFIWNVIRISNTFYFLFWSLHLKFNYLFSIINTI